MGVKLGEEVGYTIQFEDYTNLVSLMFLLLLWGILRFSGSILFTSSNSQCWSKHTQMLLLWTVQDVTTVTFLTDGVLLREMMDDPLLTKYRY